jgi:transposase InsO family protein
MVVDYSKTVNKFTHKDAYPLPRIDDLAIEVSKSKIFSTFDLKSAYHQVPILPEERPFTAFEADGQLLQFTRVPFGVTNGVSHFQRTINYLIKENKLNSTWAYLDNVTVGGSTQAEHDANVQAFYDMIEKYGLTLNHEKSIISVKEINMLGYLISHLTLKPDPERMRPLLNLPVPTDPKSLTRALGLFAYYSRWIEKFSDKIKPLTQCTSFPMTDSAITAFQSLKSDVVNSSLASPNGRDMLVIETDASDVALSASLNQNGRPIAFFSRTLQPHEKRHPAIEKEAAAIVEACRKWRHYLYNSYFKLVTDQRSVSFIFNSADHGKTKNHKIERWRIELSSLDFEITYRPGADNAAADCLSRAVIASVCATDSALKTLHDGLVHPGAARLYNFVRARNLPYSMEDVKRVISKCQVCARVKPQFYRPENPPLIKATQALERLAIDFKGPLPSVGPNKYLLTVVDEYSRYPWAFPCKEMDAKTVIDCLDEIFCWCGHAGYIHSDNGPALISKELHAHLLRQRIGHSFSSVYNPRGNGQIERMNGTIWKGVQLCLASDGLEPKHWEKTLRSVLHSIRTLVCTATNQTPHERIFRFERRTLTGHALPSWLLNKERALVRKQVRQSKYDDWVEECDILHVTPTYAQIRTDSGKEQTVSLRDLAPLPSKTNESAVEIQVESQRMGEDVHLNRDTLVFNDQHSSSHPTVTPSRTNKNVQHIIPPSAPSATPSPDSTSNSENVLRRSTSSRARCDIKRLNYDRLGGTNAICDFMNLFVS